LNGDHDQVGVEVVNLVSEQARASLKREPLSPGTVTPLDGKLMEIWTLDTICLVKAFKPMIESEESASTSSMCGL
jgi:hypothetical protein